MKNWMKKSLALIVLALTAFACGGAPDNTTATSEALNWNTVTMNVASGTMCSTTTGYCIVNESPTSPTPEFIGATLLVNTRIQSSYNVNSKSAILVFPTLAAYNVATSTINSPGFHTIQLTYNGDTPGNAKAIVNGPWFL